MQEDSFHKARLNRNAFYSDGISSVYTTQPLSDVLAPRGRVWRQFKTRVIKTLYDIYVACDVTLSVYPHRASLKNMPDHGGNRTYDLWNTSPLCRLYK